MKVKSPAGQVPAQGPIQVVQNVPVQPLQQPVPIQLAPAGIVMLAPQIFLSNLDREENHNFQVSQKRMQNPIFLSTRDWMEVHNFQEGEKVRHFCVTLIGEARVMV